MFRNSSKVSSELGTDIINFIVAQRASRKDDVIKDAIRDLEYGLSYSAAFDFVNSDCKYNRGVVRGYYSLAYYLDIISDDEYDKLTEQLFQVFDPDVILNSALNKMEGKKNGK